MHPALNRVDHRPWPLPQGPWTWRQTWLELLFAHWPVPAEVLRPLVPAGLTLEQHGGSAWLGLVPFRMEGITRRPLPPLPWLSAFPELNLRTYVSFAGKPGVWFFSLDAANLVAVLTARSLFHLPYRHARMAAERAGDEIRFRSVRVEAPAGIGFEAAYRPAGEPFAAAEGTLEHFLTERYCLYACSSRGILYRAEIHHRPWPLQRAEAELRRNELAAPFGLELRGEPALLHYAGRLEVVVWGLEPLAAS